MIQNDTMLVLARKFAKVIISSVDDESIEKTYKVLSCLCDLIESNKNLKIAMESPIVSKSDKIILFESIVKTSNLEFPEIIQKMVKFLIKNSNMKLLSMITKQYYILMIKRDNITQARICFAKNPSDQQIKEAEAILKARYKINPEIAIEVDESLFAGFILKFDGKMVDASMKNYFESIANINIE